MPRPGPARRADLDDGEIVRLRDAEGLAWDEIGRRLRASRSGVRKRYAQAAAARVPDPG
jgi:predicted DNA-binding protein (UPF0251 family)